MAPLVLWRYEIRRAGWAALLTPPVSAALIFLLAVLQTGDDELTARMLHAVLEMGLPLAVGVVAASLVGRDPATELQLSVLRAYRTTLLRRLAVTFAWTAVLAVLITVGLTLSGWWYRWPAAHDPVLGQLTWLAPALWLGGLGFLLGALLRNPASAGGLVAGVWIVEQVFGSPLHLFATTRGGADQWLANRMLLLGTGAALLVAGWLVLARAEGLVRGQDA